MRALEPRMDYRMPLSAALCLYPWSRGIWMHERGCASLSERLCLSLQRAAPYKALYLRLVVHENIENNLKRAWTRSLSDSVLSANWRSQETLLFLRCALAPLRKRS